MKEEAKMGSLQEWFECPGPEDPEDHTICCGQKCCPLRSLIYDTGNFSWIILETRHILILILESRHIDSVMKVDIRVAMAISLTVIVIRWDGHSIL